VDVAGEGGQLPSRLAVEEAAVACVGVALMAAATLQEHRGRVVDRVGLNRAHVATAVRSERYFLRGGQSAGTGFAPLSRFWRASDGWIRTHANYPWHRAALLEALGAADDADHVASTLLELPGEVAEERIFAAGGVAAAVRPLSQWQRHPHGQAIAQAPLIEHQSFENAKPRRRGAGSLPATGVRVLDLTRVIAGPVCTRYLGALGADVLRVDPPNHPDMRSGDVADTLLAKRSAALDLASPEGQATLEHLLNRTDVLVCGYRPGALDRFGLGPTSIADRHPGLVGIYLSAWGWSGPWANRRGFDSVVQAPTGIARLESPEDDTPGALPCQLLDHGTGYLAAAAALDGLRTQAEHGGTQLRFLSLARTAWWLTSQSPQPEPSPDVAAPNAPDLWVVELASAGGSVTAVRPPGVIDDHPLQWPAGPASYCSDTPTWSPANPPRDRHRLTGS
jgi:crotonobetainyl-CoA:carnitine CoA-transferase CaiB-like acyl-CoA transferase